MTYLNRRHYTAPERMEIQTRKLRINLNQISQDKHPDTRGAKLYICEKTPSREEMPHRNWDIERDASLNRHQILQNKPSAHSYG